MITGEDPQKVDQLLKWNGDCVTEKLVAHLKRKGYETYQVGLREVPRYQRPYNWSAPSITPEHVVLFGSVTNPGEASWFLVNQGVVWHNFERYTTSPLFQLCNPADDVLLLRK